jgi:hypothetical protein
MGLIPMADGRLHVRGYFRTVMSKPDLISTLFPEFFQTERSAQRHPALEAQRFEGTPLAAPLRAVSTHASQVLAELPKLAAARGLSRAEAGRHVGRLFSTLRDRIADHLIDAERSYRGTLLGMRHGIDLVQLLSAVARTKSDAQLADFCEAWLQTRTGLVKDVEAQLAWFAAHPERARSDPKSKRWLRSSSSRAVG